MAIKSRKSLVAASQLVEQDMQQARRQLLKPESPVGTVARPLLQGGMECLRPVIVLCPRSGWQCLRLCAIWPRLVPDYASQMPKADNAQRKSASLRCSVIKL